MRINQRLLAHVSGSTFSELLKAGIEHPARPRHRFDVSESLVRSKSVIHVGCVAHEPLLADKIRTAILTVGARLVPTARGRRPMRIAS